MSFQCRNLEHELNADFRYFVGPGDKATTRNDSLMRDVRDQPEFHAYGDAYDFAIALVEKHKKGVLRIYEAADEIISTAPKIEKIEVGDYVKVQNLSNTSIAKVAGFLDPNNVVILPLGGNGPRYFCRLVSYESLSQIAAEEALFKARASEDLYILARLEDVTCDFVKGTVVSGPFRGVYAAFNRNFLQALA